MAGLDNLQEIPLDIALKVGDIFNFDCYIKLPNGKIIKVNQAEDGDLIEVFKKYKAKGVEKFYATKDDLLQFLKLYQQRFSQKIFDPQTTTKQKVSSLSNTFELVKATLIQLGIEPIIIEVAERTSRDSLQFIRNVPNLFQFFKSFRAECNSEFLNIMLVNYICSIILEQFDWSSSEVKKKLSLAVLLSDITLSKEELAELHKYEDGDVDMLSEHVYNHPTEIANLIRNSRHYGVPMEIAQIIEQHHEMPNSAGFPNKLNHSRITLFSAIQIVSYHFVKKLIAYDFNYQKLNRIILELQKIFNSGNYSKALKVLVQVVAR